MLCNSKGARALTQLTTTGGKGTEGGLACRLPSRAMPAAASLTVLPIGSPSKWAWSGLKQIVMWSAKTSWNAGGTLQTELLSLSAPLLLVAKVPASQLLSMCADVEGAVHWEDGSAFYWRPGALTAHCRMATAKAPGLGDWFCGGRRASTRLSSSLWRLEASSRTML